MIVVLYDHLVDYVLYDHNPLNGLFYNKKLSEQVFVPFVSFSFRSFHFLCFFISSYFDTYENMDTYIHTFIH